ncbi:MAG: glutamate racemase [Acidimicrobiales bacterium]
MDDRPIGMFDSGFGGLTVARAVIDLLPAEHLVYLGDTARYPYGARPADEVEAFSLEIGRHLVDSFDIKLLVVACNTATAVALDTLRTELGIPVFGVIEPGVRALLQATASGRVAVIGTVGTVRSGAYQEVLARFGPDAQVTVTACPGLVEFVERGTVEGPEITVLVERLLAPVVEAKVDAMLLGCTHYPYLARVLSDAVGHGVVLVSSADETAFALAAALDELDFARRPDAGPGTHRFISSGDVRAFTTLGSQLLGPELVDAERWDPAGR